MIGLRLCTRFRHNVGADLLAVILVGEGDRQRHLYAVDRQQHLFDVEGTELDATTVDQLLDAPGNEEERPPLLTGTIEALVAAAKPAETKRLAVGSIAIKVLRHHVVATDADLAALAFAQPFAAAIRREDRHLVGDDRAADAGIAVFSHPAHVILPGLRDGQIAGVTRRLAEAVTVQDLQAEQGVEVAHQLYRQRASAADEVAEALHVDAVDAVTENGVALLPVALALFEQKLQQRRHDRDDVHPLGHHALPERRYAEAAVQHDRPADVQRCYQRGHDTVDVVDRQHAHHALVAGDALPLADAERIHHQVVLRQQHALGRAGRATGVHQQGLVVQAGGMLVATARGGLAGFGTGLIAEKGIGAIGHHSVVIDDIVLDMVCAFGIGCGGSGGCSNRAADLYQCLDTVDTPRCRITRRITRCITRRGRSVSHSRWRTADDDVRDTLDILSQREHITRPAVAQDEADALVVLAGVLRHHHRADDPAGKVQQYQLDVVVANRGDAIAATHTEVLEQEVGDLMGACGKGVVRPLFALVVAIVVDDEHLAAVDFGVHRQQVTDAAERHHRLVVRPTRQAACMFDVVQRRRVERRVRRRSIRGRDVRGRSIWGHGKLRKYKYRGIFPPD